MLFLTYMILFDADQKAQFSLSTYSILRQLSHTEVGNFPDDFMFLNEWHHFYTEIGKFPDDFMSWTGYAFFSLFGGY